MIKKKNVKTKDYCFKCTLYGWKIDKNTAAAAAKSLQSCPTLCDPIDGSPPGSPIPGILQARTREWVAISFSNAWKWKVKVKLLSRVQLLVTPWTAAHQAPPSMGFSRQEYWSGVPLPSPELPLWVVFCRQGVQSFYMHCLTLFFHIKPGSSYLMLWGGEPRHEGNCVLVVCIDTCLCICTISACVYLYSWYRCLCVSSTWTSSVCMSVTVSCLYPHLYLHLCCYLDLWLCICPHPYLIVDIYVCICIFNFISNYKWGNWGPELLQSPSKGIVSEL